MSGGVPGCTRDALLMERPQHLLESLLDCGISEAEACSAQSDVREYGVMGHVVRENRTDGKSRGRGRQAPYSQRATCQTRERSCELVRPDGIVVHEKIPTARFAMFGEMY